MFLIPLLTLGAPLFIIRAPPLILIPPPLTLAAPPLSATTSSYHKKGPHDKLMRTFFYVDK